VTPAEVRAFVLTAFSAILALDLLFSLQPSPRATGAPNERASDITFESYFTKLQQVRDRPKQRQEYADSLAGCRVRWDGYVSEVTLGRESGRPYVLLLVTRKHGDGRVARVLFPSKFRATLSSLGTGDRIRVSGPLDLSSVYYPFIDEADSMEIVSRIGRKPAP
jgi:hypothetical protein